MKYFQHDTDARTNRKLRKVLRTHGPTGYAIWWAILEELYAADDSGFQIKADELWLETLAESLCISDHRTLIRVLDSFAEVDLISRQHWEEQYLFIQAIFSRGDRYVQKKSLNARRQSRFRENTKKESHVSNALRNAKSNDVTLSEIRDQRSEIRDQRSEIRSEGEIDRDYAHGKFHGDSPFPHSEENEPQVKSETSTRTTKTPLGTPSLLPNKHCYPEMESVGLGHLWTGQGQSGPNRFGAFAESLIEGTIVHLRRHELPALRGDAIGCITNAIRRNDWAKLIAWNELGLPKALPQVELLPEITLPTGYAPLAVVDAWARGEMQGEMPESVRLALQERGVPV